MAGGHAGYTIKHAPRPRVKSFCKFF